jgi:ribosome biogenesis GTPase / thiamine phosphate phosphatase
VTNTEPSEPLAQTFDLSDWGWRVPTESSATESSATESSATESSAPESSAPHSLGRVIVQQRDLWLTISHDGELLADLRGRLRTGRSEDMPAVGDYVRLATRPAEGRATIHEVLPRRTCLQRKVAGNETRAQVIAANVDTVLIAVPLDHPVNERLVERQLVVVWESGAVPVIVGTKADADSNRATHLHQLAFGADVVTVSALVGEGLEALDPWLRHGETLAVIGPSGAGKSTLTNALLGANRMLTQDTRDADGKGRHTTTHRELVKLPGGAMLIDTPGMRELALWDADSDDGVAAVFDDIAALAAQCRFTDCQHQAEPDCAIRQALSDGSLDPNRLQSFRKLQRELAYVERQHDKRLESEERKKWAARSKAHRDSPMRRR